MDKISRIHPLLEVLKSSPCRLNKILIQKEGGMRHLGLIVSLSRSSHVPYLFVPKRALDRISPRHQGVVAFLTPKAFSSLEEILSASRLPFLVLLDGVEDPQNLGAVIRSAEGAGADGLILPERRSAGLTEAVSLVSAGALAHLKIARVNNLGQAIDRLKERGIWIIGAEGAGKEYYYCFDFTQPVGIVLGSEGKGIRPLIGKKCDKILSIPLLGKLNSLNVAAAASVFFFEVVRQRVEHPNNSA
jgi:23S rRNA (guanosine2251-2'-O)-methyltransferase